MFALVLLLATLHLTAKDNNRLFAVKPQTSIVVTLASNASTGYRWKFESSPGGSSVVRLVSRRYVTTHKNLPGAPGKEVWRFRAVGDGAMDLGFVYIRSWEPNKPARRIRIAIRVR